MGFMPSSQAGTCLTLCYKHRWESERSRSQSWHYHIGQVASLLSASIFPSVNGRVASCLLDNMRVKGITHVRHLAQNLIPRECSINRSSVLLLLPLLMLLASAALGHRGS